MAYIEGNNRSEIRFKCLEEEISKDNEVRVIDAFIDSYNKEFGKVREKRVGRNAFDPKALMKLLVNGYIHNIR
jgi:transposase